MAIGGVTGRFGAMRIDPADAQQLQKQERERGPHAVQSVVGAAAPRAAAIEAAAPRHAHTRARRTCAADA
jgi:hypothetical protein